jgi:hypothetical protein
VGKTRTSGPSAVTIAKGNLLADLLKWLGLKSLKGSRRLMFRWRRALSPVFLATLIWFIAWLWHLLAPEWWALALLIPAFGITVAVLGPKLSEGWSAVVTRVVPAGLDQGRDGVLDRKIERIYFGSLFGTVGLYLTVRAGWGGSDFTLWVWRIGLLVFGGLWWFHRRIRTAGRADRVAKKWNRLRDRDRCPEPLRALIGSSVIGQYGHGRTVILKVKLPEAVTVHAVSRLQAPLVSYYKMRPNSIHIREDEERGDVVWLTFLPKDPWAGKLAHPAPAVGSTSLRAMGKRIPMGVLVDGVEQTVSLTNHIGVYGETGGGKSGWIHSFMRWVVGWTDAIVVGIDMAGGATLNDWKAALARPLATTLEEAVVLLERVDAFIADRERQLGLDAGDDDDDSFEPTDETPWLFVIFEEFPELIKQAGVAGLKDEKAQISWAKYLQGLLDGIAKRGRKTGTKLLTGSQNGTKPDMGSKEFQGQLTCTIGLGMQEHQAKNLWGPNLMRLGWSTAGLSNGQYRQRDAEHSVPTIAKGWWVERRDRRKAAREAAELHKMAEASAWHALMGVDGPEIIMPTAPKEHTDAVLRGLADGPRTVEQLIEVTGLSKATVYRRLNRFGQERDGQPGTVKKLVTGPDAGKYALTRPGEGARHPDAGAA